MDIKIIVEAPELVSVVQSLTEAIRTPGLPVAPPSETVQEVITTKSVVPRPEDVRAKLAALSQAGKQPQVKALIASFDAEKLSDIPQERYAELLEKAEAL